MGACGPYACQASCGGEVEQPCAADTTVAVRVHWLLLLAMQEVGRKQRRGWREGWMKEGRVTMLEGMVLTMKRKGALHLVGLVSILGVEAFKARAAVAAGTTASQAVAAMKVGMERCC